MTLTPTTVTIQGKRVWLQDAGDADIAYVAYRATLPSGLHIENNPKLPKAERIEYAVSEGPSPIQPKENDQR